jgi:hypothetical protein
MTSAKAAASLGVSQRHVSRLVIAEKLTPAFTMEGRNGAHLFDPAEVQRYKTEREGR